MSVDVFERIAAFAEREDETVRFEFIDGRPGPSSTSTRPRA
jgi:hypothetical protein